MQILFSDETVMKFEIAFAEEDSELGARCDADFGGTCAAITYLCYLNESCFQTVLRLLQ